MALTNPGTAEYRQICAHTFGPSAQHRDPVTRAISAFNWQSYDSKGIKNAGGDLYTKVYDECFPTANTFAEGLGEEGECLSIWGLEPPTSSRSLDQSDAHTRPELMSGQVATSPAS